MAAIALVRLALFLALSADRQIALIPDDAFYYLVSARNFALLGAWTFDGQAPATGFHLLYAYALAGLFWLVPGIGDTALYAVIAGAGTALLTSAAYLAARAVARDFGAAGVLGVVLVFTAPLALRQQTYLVESCLLIFLSSALLALWSRAGELEKPTPGWLATAFALGLLANLARSDFGLLPAACALACFALRRRSPGARAQAALAAVATLGAALGVVAVSLHTLHWSGSLVQSSALMKQHWSSLIGYDLRGYVRWLVFLIAPPDARWIGARGLPLVVLGAGAVGAGLRLGASALRLDRWPLAAGCALSLLGYVVFYGANSASLPPWYLANALAAVAYLSGGVTSFVPRRVFATCAAVVAAWAIASLGASLAPFLNHQVAMKAAGEYLRAHPEVETAAAWNAGVVAWFARRPVINLDGLVNDEVYPYATSGRLLDYACLRKVDAIIDYGDMLQNAWVTQRGGHGDGRLRARLTPEVDFTHGDPDLRWMNSDLALYRFDRSGCPAASGTSESPGSP